MLERTQHEARQAVNDGGGIVSFLPGLRYGVSLDDFPSVPEPEPVGPAQAARHFVAAGFTYLSAATRPGVMLTMPWQPSSSYVSTDVELEVGDVLRLTIAPPAPALASGPGRGQGGELGPVVRLRDELAFGGCDLAGSRPVPGVVGREHPRSVIPGLCGIGI